MSFAVIAAGIPAGPKVPTQLLTSNPVSVSASAGNSGAAGERPAPRTAIPFSFPAFTCGSTVGMVANNIDVWPPRRSVIAGTLPL